MEQFFKYANEIIGAAASSLLGILALIILTLGVLAYFFFRQASEAMRVLIFVLVLIAGTAFGVVVLDKSLSNVEKIESEKNRQLAVSDKTIEAITIRSPDEVVVDFPLVDTASAPGYTVAAAPYLHDVGISIAGMKPQASEIVLINNRALYQGQAVIPTTSQNILTQVNTNNGPASFTLTFSKPFASVRFVRPTLYPATKSGITHPAWSAHALDTAGRELSSQSEDLTRSFVVVPARAYTLTAPGLDGISAIRFDSDPRLSGGPFAAFSAVLIERLTMARREK